MLIQLVFFIFMLMAVTALYVDLGLARLSQAQMQNAADTAALEGLRQRDAGGGDTGRRAAAAKMAALTFDDDLNLSNGNTNRIGAGPDLVLSGGLDGDLNAGQLIAPVTDAAGNPQSVRDPINPSNNRSGVYTPNLQTNTSNAEYGDMVGGTYVAGQPPTEDSAFSAQPYMRRDFTPTGGTPPSFLVRLRRTDHRTDALTPDPDRNPGVSSSGESLSLLFGLGGTIQKQTDTSLNPNNYSPRVNGITVRATAIADSRPALRVGPPNPGLAIPGVTPFAVTASFWTSLASGVPQPVSVDTTGTLMQSGAPVGQYGVAPQTVGMARPWPAPASLVTNPTGYVPIYEGPPTLDVDRVIGFGFVTVTGSCSGPGASCVLTGATTSTVAPVNATAVLPGGLPAPAAEQSAVLAANASLGGALLVPFLAR